MSSAAPSEQEGLDLTSLPDADRLRPDQLAWINRPCRTLMSGEMITSKKNEGMWIVDSPLGAAVMLRSYEDPKGWSVVKARNVPVGSRGNRGCLFASGVDPRLETVITMDIFHTHVNRWGVVAQTRRELLAIIREAVRRRIIELKSSKKVTEL